MFNRHNILKNTAMSTQQQQKKDIQNKDKDIQNKDKDIQNNDQFEQQRENID